MTQTSDETGCGTGCILIGLTFPLIAIFAMLDERKKKQAEKLEEENRILRLETERERLEEGRDKARAERERRKMEDAGYVQCSRCKEWRDEVRTDGICEPCKILEELL